MTNYDDRDPLVRSIAVERRSASLSVGTAIGDTFRVIGRAWVQLYAMSFLVAAASLPFAILYAREMTLLLERLKSRAPTSSLPMEQSTFYAYGVAFYVLQVVVSIYVFATTVEAACRMLESGRCGFGAAMQAGLARFLPMLFAAVMFYIVLGLGLVLVIAPGLIFGAAFGLAPALCVVERRGPLTSFSRSADLTRGNRWRCIAVTLLLTLVPGLIAVGIGLAVTTSVGKPVNFLVSAATNFFALPIFYVFPAVLAHSLRRLKEGGGPSSVAAVF